MCSEGLLEHIQVLVDNEMIELLADALRSQNDPVLLKVALEALENILKFGSIAYTRADGNPFVIKLANCDGFPAIEALQSHPDNTIYTIVSRIIETYLEYEGAA